MRIKSQFGFHADFIIGICHLLLFFKEDSAKTDE